MKSVGAVLFPTGMWNIRGFHYLGYTNHAGIMVVKFHVNQGEHCMMLHWAMFPPSWWICSHGWLGVGGLEEVSSISVALE